jgi:hypothetical protein
MAAGAPISLFSTTMVTRSRPFRLSSTESSPVLPSMSSPYFSHTRWTEHFRIELFSAVFSWGGFTGGKGSFQRAWMWSRFSQDRNCNGLKNGMPDRSLTVVIAGTAATTKVYIIAGATIIGHFLRSRAVLVCSILKTDIAFYLTAPHNLRPPQSALGRHVCWITFWGAESTESL